jgi:hypothetical protein
MITSDDLTLGLEVSIVAKRAFKNLVHFSVLTQT